MMNKPLVRYKYYGDQSFQSLSAPPESTDVNDNPFSSLSSFDDGVRESVLQLRDKLEDFCKEDLKNITNRVTSTNIVPKTRNDFLQYSHQFTLDPNTAHQILRLSERNRVIKFTYTVQPYPDHPDRFDYFEQVLCRESVCGRCYWEIEWSGRSVLISVSYKSISRKGRETKLPVEPISSRIGVYVDHSAGTLSFYNISDTLSLIHTVQTTFTDTLHRPPPTLRTPAQGAGDCGSEKQRYFFSYHLRRGSKRAGAS
ncbi:unnamed protein product [Leuciscus chuanchicus]